MKIVYRAGDIIEAEIVKGMLVSNDIEAHISGYYLQGGIGELSPADLGKVNVPDEDYERAEELVRKYEGIKPEQKNSNHQSPEVKANPKKGIIFTIVMIIIVTVVSYWFSI